MTCKLSQWDRPLFCQQSRGFYIVKDPSGTRWLVQSEVTSLLHDQTHFILDNLDCGGQPDKVMSLDKMLEEGWEWPPELMED